MDREHDRAARVAEDVLHRVAYVYDETACHRLDGRSLRGAREQEVGDKLIDLPDRRDRQRDGDADDDDERGAHLVHVGEFADDEQPQERPRRSRRRCVRRRRTSSRNRTAARTSRGRRRRTERSPRSAARRRSRRGGTRPCRPKGISQRARLLRRSASPADSNPFTPCHTVTPAVASSISPEKMRSKMRSGVIAARSLSFVLLFSATIPLSFCGQYRADL